MSSHQQLCRFQAMGLVTLVSLFVCVSVPIRAADDPRTPSVSDNITVSGNEILRGGIPWVANGVVSVAFVDPQGSHNIYANALAHLNDGEMESIREWGANTIRMQVSQPALDPKSPLYLSGFVATVDKAVQSARRAGLNVIVSIQDEKQTGDPNPSLMPSDATGRAWAALVPQLHGDLGVMFELFNEPRGQISSANWQQWETAHNALIAMIRGMGAKNVIIVDGLEWGGTLEDAPILNDPAGQLAYSVHPYFKEKTTSIAAFQSEFGNMAQHAPIILTEWALLVRQHCDSQAAPGTRELIAFIKAHHIGIMGYAYDNPGMPGTPRFGKTGGITIDYKGTPSTLDGKVCGDAGFGPGEILQHYYRTGDVETAAK